MKIRTVWIVIAIAGASLPTLGQTNKNVRRQVLCDSLRFSRREALARFRFQVRRLSRWCCNRLCLMVSRLILSR